MMRKISDIERKLFLWFIWQIEFLLQVAVLFTFLYLYHIEYACVCVCILFHASGCSSIHVFCFRCADIYILDVFVLDIVYDYIQSVYNSIYVYVAWLDSICIWISYMCLDWLNFICVWYICAWHYVWYYILCVAGFPVLNIGRVSRNIDRYLIFCLLPICYGKIVRPYRLQ